MCPLLVVVANQVVDKKRFASARAAQYELIEIVDDAPAFRFVIEVQIGKHGKIDPVGTDEIDPVKTA